MGIEEFLKEFGLEIPEDKKPDFSKKWKENFHAKDEFDKLAGDRDAYKKSLEDVQGQLKQFENVNVEDLKTQITTLTEDLKKKDDEYAAKEAERVFNGTVGEAIRTAGGKNSKAVMALLNLEELKASKNQGEDIKAAIEAVKKSDSYLFASEEPFANRYVGGTGGAGGGGTDALANVRRAMGLPPENNK